MTGIDLIVVAPWLIFAAALLVVCIRLFRARRTAKRPAPRHDASGSHASRRHTPEPQPERGPHPQGTQCPNKNAQAPGS